MPSKLVKEQNIRDRLYVDLFGSIYRMNSGEHDLLARFADAIDQSGRAVIRRSIELAARIHRSGYNKVKHAYLSRHHGGHANRMLAHIDRIRTDPDWTEPQPTGPKIEPRRLVYNRIRHHIGKMIWEDIYRIAESHYVDAKSFAVAMSTERHLRART